MYIETIGSLFNVSARVIMEDFCKLQTFGTDDDDLISDNLMNISSNFDVLQNLPALMLKLADWQMKY